MGEVKAHDAIMRLQKGSVDREVCWGARVRLHIHAPLLWVQAKH